MSEPAFFVWVDTQRGVPSPQIWIGDKTRDGTPVPTLHRHQLYGEAAELARAGRLSLAGMALTFPPPRAVQSAGAERQAPEGPLRSDGPNGEKKQECFACP